MQVEENDKLKAPGILILWGGSDIHPSLYGRENVHSYVGAAPSERDRAEVKLATQAIKKGVFIFGVCRGAQLGCALAGGVLVQNVDGHNRGAHRIETKEGETFLTTSAHHQMLYPWQTDHELLAWSATPRSTVYDGLSEDELKKWPKREYETALIGSREDVIEPEAVWFPKIKCLTVQGHPEWMESSSSFNRYVKRIISAYCLTS